MADPARPMSRADRSRASARLGLTFRTVLLAPREGFEAAVKATERRQRSGRWPIEGLSTYVLTALGGASLAALWLKMGALFKLRQVCTAEYIPAYVALALVVGAVLALIAQFAWGAFGRSVIESLKGSAGSSGLRLVWGASALPQILVLVVLIPLDLLIVGTPTFTTQPLNESLSTAWAAFSIALSVSLAVWSIYLFVRGVEVVGGLPARRAVVATAFAALCLAVAMAALVVPTALTVSKEAACPTRLG